MSDSIALNTVYIKENSGHGNARRLALKNCKNKIVALMDADDISLPTRFERQLDFIKKNKDISVVGGQISEFVGNPENIKAIRNVPLDNKEIISYMKKRCPMNQVTVMFEKEAVEESGGYRDWYCEEDYYLWLRMMQKGYKFGNLPDVLVNVRAGEEMTARRGGIKYFESEKRLQLYMLKRGIISYSQYFYNIGIRFMGEVVANEWSRGKLFKLMRTSVTSSEKKFIIDEMTKQTKLGSSNEEFPPFSVAMSVYGKDNVEWFDIALNSIVEQTVKPNEIVLVVDGPVPQVIHDVIEKYSEICRAGGVLFRVIQLPENKGLGNALRIAVKKCSNEIIARMDSDDISIKNRFEQQLEILLLNPQIDIIGGDIQEFIEVPDNQAGKRVVPVTDGDIKNYMRKRCPFNHVTVMYKKSAVQKSGGYKDLFWNEDYYLWIRMAENGCHMANTGTVLVNVRVGADMYKRRGGYRYFKSEKFLQDYMLKKQLIGIGTYMKNVGKRFILQVMMPASMRGWAFQKLARN